MTERTDEHRLLAQYLAEIRQKPLLTPAQELALGEQMRLTVRIPKPLYERLTTFVEGYRYSRGVPQLAGCVREALEEYLDNKEQTKNTLSAATPIYGQTENSEGYNFRRTKRVRGKRTDLSARILTLLQSHPEGLSAEEIRVYLKPEKPIGDTLQGMVRTGKLRGVGSGQQKTYCLAGDE